MDTFGIRDKSLVFIPLHHQTVLELISYRCHGASRRVPGLARVVHIPEPLPEFLYDYDFWRSICVRHMTYRNVLVYVEILMLLGLVGEATQEKFWLAERGKKLR